MSALLKIIARDMKLALRRRGGIFFTLFFCLLVISLFPFAVGVEPGLMEKIGVGIIWISALLVSTLNLPQLFEDDFEDGSLEAAMLMPVHISVISFAKIIAHWLVSGVPLALASPLFAMLLGIGEERWVDLVLSLLLGTFLLTLLGALAGALSLGVKKAWMLLALLVLPLNVPVLIFAVATLGEAREQGYMGLGFLLLILLPITLFAAVSALKVAVQES